MSNWNGSEMKNIGSKGNIKISIYSLPGMGNG
jgi:hypothetical protein